MLRKKRKEVSMEPEGSLPYSQQPANYPHPKPDQSSTPHFFKDPF
jgi:hypothetical protein